VVVPSARRLNAASKVTVFVVVGFAGPVSKYAIGPVPFGSAPPY
jgi:hypothetical protein